jgi:hypothetical protein
MGKLQQELAQFRREQMAMQLAQVADARMKEDQKWKEVQQRQQTAADSAARTPTAVPVRRFLNPCPHQSACSNSFCMHVRQLWCSHSDK